jgi:hypothetical protein
LGRGEGRGEGPYVDAVLSMITVCESFCDPLAFVVACSRTNAVDVPPVTLTLGMLSWRAVNFCHGELVEDSGREEGTDRRLRRGGNAL